MMMLRRGPAMGPAVTPGGAGGAPGAAQGMPSTPGTESPGNMLMAAIADQVNQQKKSNANFASGNIGQIKRVAAAMVVHLSHAHPEVARHLNRAWSSLDQAEKALKDAFADETPGTIGPPLGFSGAQIGPSEAMGAGMGGGGGGMGVPR